jgi:hypothetical protein
MIVRGFTPLPADPNRVFSFLGDSLRLCGVAPESDVGVGDGISSGDSRTSGGGARVRVSVAFG